MFDNNIDHNYLNQALALAKIRRGFCSPNPSVGAIITLDNKVLATGYHLAAGLPHAEVAALQKLDMQAPGATMYVTLEPCCHWGKTPPCIENLIRAGIKRVVYAYRDPNPAVSGKGELALRAQGILCESISLPEINAFYESYHHWCVKKTPFVTAKIALSLNGKIAGKLGERISITGKELQILTHDFRQTADALLTTARTIIYDDPQFNVRCSHEMIAKPIYVLDSELNLPPTAAIFNTAKSLTVFHAEGLSSPKQQQWVECGIRCIPITRNQQGLDLQQVIDFIGQKGIHDLWIEAGGKCFSAFAAQKLLQRALIYVAPRWIGAGQVAFADDYHFDIDVCTIRWQQYGNDALCDIRW